MKRLSYSLILLMSLLLCSCGNDFSDVLEASGSVAQGLTISGQDEETGYSMKSGTSAIVPEDGSLSRSEELQHKIINFTYKGNNYSSSYYRDSVSTLIYENEEVEKLIEKLKLIQTLAIVMKSDETMDIYDNDDERKSSSRAKTNFANSMYPASFVSNVNVRFWNLSKGRVMGGEFLEIYSKNTVFDKSPPSYYCPALRPVEDNSFSSFQIWAEYGTSYAYNSDQFTHVALTLYENVNYGGRSVHFPDDIFPGKTYSERDYLDSFNFDNITSSFIIGYHN